jgi:DNA-binding transcriptional ArsR family regulator
MLDQLSLKLQALSDPTRRAILAKLKTGEATVNELAEPFAMTLPAISKHIKVLETAGLITRSRNAQQRPCKLSTDGLKEVDDWMNNYREM